MIDAFKFSTAGRIIFGENSLLNLGEIVKRFNAENVLVVTDKGISQSGLVDKVMDIVLASGVNAIVYDKAEPEPPIQRALECAYEYAKGKKIQVVIGLGGGSSIDLAKIVTLLLTYGGKPQDYYGEFNVPGPVMPLIAISTTSGTGSEVSPAAVITDEEAKLKIAVSDYYLQPTIALVDPVLTLSLPPEYTAYSGMDVLCHAIEAYTAIYFRYLEKEGEVIYQGSSEITDTFALKAIELVGKSLRLAVDQGANLEARSDMSLANVFAGMAFANAGVGAAHALSYPLGANFHAPHGLLTGLLLPHVMEYNLPVRQEKMAKVAVALGEDVEGCSPWEAGEKAVEAVKRLIADVRMPSRLRDLGVKEEMLPDLAKRTLDVKRLLRSNPRRVTAEYLEGILRSAF